MPRHQPQWRLWGRLVVVMPLLLASSGGCGDDEGGDGDDGGGTPGTAGAVSAEVQSSLLDAHNQVRQTASPTPDPPLEDLTWDPSLSESAGDWAKRCLFEHSSSGVGENIYASTAESAPSAVVESWASEAADFNYADNSCSAVCGHYTQIVWRDTQRVGCGFADCPDLAVFGGPGQLWVCQYDPPGNYIGEQPY